MTQQVTVNWTVEQLLGEIAAMLVRLENGEAAHAHTMGYNIVGHTEFYKQARAEYQEMIEELEAERDSP